MPTTNKPILSSRTRALMRRAGPKFGPAIPALLQLRSDARKLLAAQRRLLADQRRLLARTNRLSTCLD